MLQIGIRDILWKGTKRISQLIFKLFKISKYSCQDMGVGGSCLLGVDRHIVHWAPRDREGTVCGDLERAKTVKTRDSLHWAGPLYPQISTVREIMHSFLLKLIFLPKGSQGGVMGFTFYCLHTSDITWSRDKCTQYSQGDKQAFPSTDKNKRSQWEKAIHPSVQTIFVSTAQ